MTLLLLPSELSAALNTLADQAGVKARLIEILEQAGATLENFCERNFDETFGTRYACGLSIERGGDRLGGTLYLPNDLRTLTTITDGAGGTFTSDQYVLAPRNADRNLVLAYRTITLKSPAVWNVANDMTSPAYQDIAITGTWGYGGEWKTTGATLGASQSDSAATFTASNGALVEAGMTVKIGSEYQRVESISTNTVTVTRGVNGSTAAAHNSGDVVYRWKPLPIVRQLVERLASWRLQQAQSPLLGQVVVGDVIFPVATDGLPRDVISIIQNTGLQRARRFLG